MGKSEELDLIRNLAWHAKRVEQDLDRALVAARPLHPDGTPLPNVASLAELAEALGGTRSAARARHAAAVKRQQKGQSE